MGFIARRTLKETGTRRMYKQFTLIFFILLYCTTGTNAQVLKCQLKHYSTEDGLSHEKVTCMLKDRDGFMWFGTWDGMDRFDGHTFITFKSYAGDNTGLKNNRVNEIIEGQGNYLWVRADDRQVYRFDKKTGEFIGIASLFKERPFTKYVFEKMTVTSGGIVWLLSEKQGVVALSESGSQHSAYRYAKELSGDRHLPSNKISFFKEDQQHNIWIGTPDGLCQLSPGTDRIYHSTNNPYSSGYSVNAMAESNTQIVFTTPNGNLIAYHKRQKRFALKNITANEGINAACISAKKNVVYCSTSGGKLLVLDNVDFNILSTIKIDTSGIYSIYEDKGGLVWIEPKYHGIIKYAPATNKLKRFTQHIYSDYPNGSQYYNIFEDNAGHLWANIKGGGFGYYNTQTDAIDPFFNNPSLPDYQFSNKVIYQYYDKAGILWLCTEDRGIDKIVFLENDFNLQPLVKNSLIKSDNDVRAVYTDRKNRLWVGSKRKLYVFENGHEITGLFKNEPYNVIGQIYCILEDHTGTMWIGTKGNGLYKAEPVDNSCTKYQLSHYVDNSDANSLSSHIIYTILEDKQNRLWIGTYGSGLNQAVTTNHETRFNSAKNLFKNYPKILYQKIRHLEQDAAGNLWIGTTDGLLIANTAIANDTKIRYARYNKIPDDKQSLGNNDIQFIYRDTKNRMWLSTSGGGLNLAIGNDPIRSLRFRSFTIDDGLPNDFILSTVEDNKQNLWIATQKGLSKFNIAGNTFKNYDSYDGLPQSGFSEGTCLKQPNGTLVFGTLQGFLSLNPATITDRKINANMALTNFQVSGHDAGPYHNQFRILKTDIHYTPEVTLLHNQNTISIDYSMLDFRSANKQSYSYRLIGVDTAWSKNVVNHRKVTYSNLAPGKYVFQVKSSDDYLYTNSTIKSLPITILPPPWLTWWAYLIYFILGFAILELIRRVTLTMLRLRQRIAVEQKLTDLKLSFFTNISHELRTPLSLILNPIDAIVDQENLSPQGLQYARTITKNANRMVRFINQLLDLRKVQSGKVILHLSEVNIIAFITNITEYFNELGNEKGITINIQSNVKQLFAWIDAEKLDIVIYNLLANAFKFSDNGTTIIIQVDEQVELKHFTIKIIDQGIGVPKNKLNDIFELYYEGEQKPDQYLKGTGIGLALSKELIDLHHGKIVAFNNQEKGLTVAIELKTGKAHFENQNVVFIDDPDLQYQRLHPQPEDEQTIISNHYDTSLPLVLLVEDNNDLRSFLAIQLSNNYHIVEAENGEEAWEKAITHLPDLVLTDVMMPKMNGIQLLDKLKNNTETSHIPVIILSAKTSVESQIEGLNYGADYYITKPFNNNLVLSSIANLIKQRKQIFEHILKGSDKPATHNNEITITVKDELFLKNVIRVVEDKMSDSDFNIDILTEAAGMSRSAFYRKFKSLTGQTPVEFLRDMRLKKGKELLDTGEENISQVAYAVGFTDPKYFGTCFKKQYALSPSEYLRNRSIKLQAI
ncbi:response regulator [Mucilaginibacter sp. HMF5004]|uniref:hybrid sensor histidine kinase/response regulator transcription factor n=1 Tax=Mucilaginibacter rivuli TaxID=2857527 RepID=UPI001C5D3655|nr:hybrid sensor histidine kinase/response regulator transcription factor [Mucilaginibacter rivuli]MBW4891874.1 response regulator [Mucilaginibacter rivuli]